jgi:hypothetical protein
MLSCPIPNSPNDALRQKVEQFILANCNGEAKERAEAKEESEEPDADAKDRGGAK